MVGKRIHTGGATSGCKGARAITALAPVFALALVFTIAAPVGFDSGFGEKSAVAAGKGNGPDKDKGGGKGSNTTPEEQASQIEQDSTCVTCLLESDGGEVAEKTSPQTPLLPEDENADRNQVIRELAGLPEESALSEEEELEAIRSGWSTWRTADGPRTITSQ
ncbi:hypothetical protein LCGC14_2602180 [marine sediment metagenome]|uniref:Uncharacterized protein n=1 Tax=marine sediment metagenome TaxID=412755 RepID=A0A0F9A8F2_9ZZZZ